MPRTIAIFLAYLIGFALLGGTVVLIVLTAATQVTDLVNNLPHYTQETKRLEPQVLALLHPFGVTKTALNHTRSQALAAIQGVGTAAAKDSVAIVAGVVGTVIDVVLVLILSVYLTANGPNIVALLRRETPDAQRFHTAIVIAIVQQVAGGYVRGQITLSALIGVLVGVGTALIGVPYAVLLGVLAFFMEFVPIIGVLISGAVSVLLALTVGPFRAVLVLGYFVFVHVIEGDVVGPRIMGRALGIHPATAIVALVAGTELFGIWGALLAAPIAGMIQAVVSAAWQELHGAHPQEVLDAVVQQNQMIEQVEEEKRHDEGSNDEPPAVT
jgi:predicted PurR-regulated permease PerM